MTWAATTKRTKQKSGAWTRKKLRRKRLAEQQAAGIQSPRQHREKIERAFPHLKDQR